jgi:uncharacterized protein
MKIDRTHIFGAVIESLAEFPAVALLGARQVGKTTLAKAIAAANEGSVYLDLEDEPDRLKLGDARAFLGPASGRLIIIDEIHRAPALFPQLRGIIDERRRQGQGTGQFLLLGSASFELMHQASETLAGRINYLDMLPVQPDEATAAGISVDTTWLRGGFPNSLNANSDQISFRWRQAFIRSYLERDVPMFAPRMPSETIGRAWRMLATNQGSPLNQSRLAQNLDVTGPMINRYVDLLSDLLMIRRLQPWSGNLAKRLVKSPKVYVRDSGLLHTLLGIGTMDQLLGHISLGSSWEGFVIESLIAAAGDSAIPLYYRTIDGAEIDLVFEVAGRVALAIEIKRSSAPIVPKGFYIACDDLDAQRRILVHSGSDSWQMGEGIEAMSLIDAIKTVRKVTGGPFA